MNSNSVPLVSIGLPVYNGQNFLEQAIESVLNLSHDNWELLISDNGSTDSTAAICQKYLKQDKRIIYSRFEENTGASRNYRKTFEMSNGKYFRWLAHDDLLSPESVSLQVEVLESHPDVVLCGSSKRVIDAQGELINIDYYPEMHLIEDDVLKRYHKLLNYFQHSNHMADFIFGLMRTKTLEQTNLIANITAADFILLVELVLNGKVYALDEPLVDRRLHHGVSSSIYNNKSEISENLDLSTEIKWKNHVELAKWYDPKAKGYRIPHFKWLNLMLTYLKELDFDRKKKNDLIIRTYKWFIPRFFYSITKNIKSSLKYQ